MPKSSASGRSACKICNNLDPRGHPATFYDAESASPSIASLTLAVDSLDLKREGSRCLRCKVLCDALGLHFPAWHKKHVRVCIELAEKKSIKVELRDGVLGSSKLELYVARDERPPWPTLGSAHKISPHSGSDRCFEFARKAIENCLTNHRDGFCGQGARDRAFPSRLIDVGDSAQDVDYVKLCKCPNDTVKYVALSHCWGKNPIFITTKATLEERMTRIDRSSLPNLFQDALRIARGLQVQYLWIDALCILQDSKADWEAESTKMGSVYENAYVTIAASAAPNSDTAILSKRSRPGRIEYQTNPRAKVHDIYVRKMVDHHPNPVEQAPACPEGPLRTRAWAFQERALCSRILHYTETELMFECKVGFCCECSPALKSLPTTPGLISKLASSKKKRACWTMWHDIVAQYTTRDLSVPSDKLPAISAIAEKVQRPTGSAYLAGLWRDNLVEDLLWSSDQSLQHPHEASRLSNYRAPSFSWASVETQVQYHEPDESEISRITSNIRILDARIELAGTMALGEVKDGFIRLAVPVLEASLIAPKPYSFTYNLSRPGHLTVGMAPDSLLVEDNIPSPTGTRHTARRARSGETYAPFKVPITCVVLVNYSHQWVSGLVLGYTPRDVLAVPNACNVYERLGVFSCGSEWLQNAQTREIVIV